MLYVYIFSISLNKNMILNRIKLLNRLRPLNIQSLRNDSIFTKYREPPNGFLFNQKPLKPGEKRKLETWELIWYTGWGVCIVTFLVGSYYQPDDNILDWATREAEKRIAEIENS